MDLPSFIALQISGSDQGRRQVGMVLNALIYLGKRC